MHFCLLSYFEISRCFVKSLILHQHIFWWNTTEKRKLEKCFLGTRVFGPKPVYWSPKQPGYITGFMADIKFLKMLSVSLQNRIIFYLTWMQNTSKKKRTCKHFLSCGILLSEVMLGCYKILNVLYGWQFPTWVKRWVTYLLFFLVQFS